MTSRDTGLSKSSRLRTERVVVRTSSADRFKVMTGDYIRCMTAELTPEVSGRLTEDVFGWLTTVAKSGLPVPRLIWFLLDGSDLVLYTMPSAAKVAHIRRHPQVSLNLIPTAKAAASSSSAGRPASTPRGRLPHRRTVLGQVRRRRRAGRVVRRHGRVQHPDPDHHRQGVDHAGGLTPARSRITGSRGTSNGLASTTSPSGRRSP